MRRIRLLGLVAADLVILAGSLLLALWIRFDGVVPARYFQRAIDVLPFYVAGGLIIYYVIGLYSRLWRYASIYEAGRVVAAALLASVWLGGLVYFRSLALIGFPRSVILIAFMLLVLGTGILRLSARFVYSSLSANTRTTTPREDVRRTLIVGAGDGGVMLLREFMNRGVRPVGFIDDDPMKQGKSIHGVFVLGSRGDMPALIQKHNVNDVVIAMPSAPKPVVREIYEEVRKIPNVAVRTVPMLYDFVTGKATVGQPRPVDVTDLLGRDPVKINMREVASYLQGRRVLVTGAGGSIGSELCRQIAAYGPSSLILLDHDENGVFDIQHELRTRFPSVELKAVIADIRDRNKINRVFQEDKPAVVFHAAAHKHVPFMEDNPEEAVKTNVFGTQNVAEAALANGTDRFVLISTDKAVNPTSVMGATKRVAELVVQNLNTAGKTRFMAVRFGNVLGSRGSVVPLFQKQIAQGGPVTITDPEMTRYFMTIPEAVQLVMQAAALGQGGEVFVLDMGEPVKIVDLARTLIRWHGLEPDRDIKIVVTGRRPGEKLYEEVLTAEEGTEATKYDRIYSARVHAPDPEVLESRLAELEKVTFGGNHPLIVEKLVQLVPTYEPEEMRQRHATFAYGSLREVAATAPEG